MLSCVSRRPLNLSSGLRRETGIGRSSDDTPAALASRFMNSGVETCSSSATIKRSNVLPLCAGPVNNKRAKVFDC